MNRSPHLARILPLIVAASVTVVADEGVLEINGTVVQHGLEPCDSTPGYPCVIDEPGSYRLTGNLKNTAGGGPAYPDTISIEADNVTLDLNGHAIIGPNECSWNDATSEVTCTIDSATSGSGVVSTNRRVTVRNGAIHSAAYDGVRLGSFSRAQDLAVSQAGQSGILANVGSLIRGCTVELTAGGMLFVGAGSVVADNDIRQGLSPMIFNGSVVADIEISQSASNGLVTHPGCLVRDANIYEAADHCFAYSPFDAPVDTGGLMLRATAALCGASGLDVATDCVSGYTSMAIVSDGTAIDGDAVQLGPSLCNGSTTCP